jgi:hypothetical protein
MRFPEKQQPTERKVTSLMKQPCAYAAASSASFPIRKTHLAYLPFQHQKQFSKSLKKSL